MSNQSRRPLFLRPWFIGAMIFLGLAGYGYSKRDDSQTVSPVSEPAGIESGTTAPAVEPTPRPLEVIPSSITQQVAYLGYVPKISEEVGPLRCDFSQGSSNKAQIEWSDGQQAYSIDGDLYDMAQLYLKLLGLERWQRCRYSVRNHVLTAFGDESAADQAGTLDAYVAKMNDTAVFKPTPSPTPYRRDYVLNNETKVFHYPSCYQAGRINGRKRQEITTSREKLIESGYSSCGNCNP